MKTALYFCFALGPNLGIKCIGTVLMGIYERQPYIKTYPFVYFSGMMMYGTWDTLVLSTGMKHLIDSHGYLFSAWQCECVYLRFHVLPKETISRNNLKPRVQLELAKLKIRLCLQIIKPCCQLHDAGNVVIGTTSQALALRISWGTRIHRTVQ